VFIDPKLLKKSVIRIVLARYLLLKPTIFPF